MSPSKGKFVDLWPLLLRLALQNLPTYVLGKPRPSTIFFNKFILFIYFWLHLVFIAALRLSLVAASRGYSSLRCAGLQWLLVAEHRLLLLQ